MSTILTLPPAKEISDNLIALILFQYGKKEDYFDAQITRMVQDIISNRTMFRQTDDQVKEELTNRTLQHYPLAILTNLDLLRTEFPGLFENEMYGPTRIAAIQSFCSSYITGNLSVASKQSLATAEFRINKPIASYSGGEMILGCGHGTGDHLHEETYCIDKSATMNPDMTADYYSQAFWRELPDGKFKTVTFEGFGPFPHRASLSEIARILKPDGQAVLIYDECYRWLATKGTTLQDYFASCGFSRIEIQKDQGLLIAHK